MADDKPPNHEGKQVMDVSKPGHTTPSPSSRPILLKHQPILQDPMFNSSKFAKDDSSEDSDDSGHTESKDEDKISAGMAPPVRPPHPDIKPDELEKAEEPDTKAPALQPETQHLAPETDHPPAGDQPQASNNKPQADIAQLVHDKTYFMPITQLPRRYGLLWVLLAVALLAIAAVVYFLLMTSS